MHFISSSSLYDITPEGRFGVLEFRDVDTLIGTINPERKK
jgi:hypothetical protein